MNGHYFSSCELDTVRLRYSREGDEPRLGDEANLEA